MNPTETARGLRALATRRDAQATIDRDSAFPWGASWAYGFDEASAPDRCVPHPITGATEIPAHPLTPMELIDDACDFERIADRLSKR